MQIVCEGGQDYAAMNFPQSTVESAIFGNGGVAYRNVAHLHDFPQSRSLILPDPSQRQGEWVSVTVGLNGGKITLTGKIMSSSPNEHNITMKKPMDGCMMVSSGDFWYPLMLRN